MEFHVRLFLDGKRIDPSEYKNIAISCKTIDRIVNDIYERYHEIDDDASMQSEMRQGEITMSF